MRRRYWPLLLLLAMCLAATAFLVRAVAVDYGARDVSRTAQERLRLISPPRLSTSIERFRYLPDVVARSREIEDLFRQSATPEQGLAANQLLKRISDASGAMALFVTDRTGLTIAASNFDSPAASSGRITATGPISWMRSPRASATTTQSGNHRPAGLLPGDPDHAGWRRCRGRHRQDRSSSRRAAMARRGRDGRDE